VKLLIDENQNQQQAHVTESAENEFLSRREKGAGTVGIKDQEPMQTPARGGPRQGK
jgi:hypothetical protein